jgi:hypothetical protein
MMTDVELQNLVAENSRQVAEVWALFRETDKKLDRVSEQMKETDNKIAKIANLIKKTDKKLTDQFGRFVENFLVPGIPKVFQDRGIPIRWTSLRVKANLGGDNMEIDLLAVNAEYVILVEAKNVVKADYIKHHLRKLDRFKEFFPEYRDKKVLGAMAGLEFASDCDTYAISEGLFVITLGGETVRIANTQEFRPKVR